MRSRSLLPVSKNTSSPSVKSSRAPVKRERGRRDARATPRTLPKSREKNVTTRSLSPSGKLPITTAGDLPSDISGRHAQPELHEGALVFPPVLPHLDREIE